MFFIRLAAIALGAIAITVLGCVWAFTDGFAFAFANGSLEEQLENGAQNHDSKRDLTAAEEVVLKQMIACAQKDGSAPTAVKSLAEALRHPDHSVRAAAAWALGRIGLKSLSVLPDLRDACGDQDDEVKKTACLAVERITSKAMERAPIDNESEIFWVEGPRRWTAAAILAGRHERFADESYTSEETPTADKSKDPEIVVKALTEALKDADASVRQEAVQALGRMGDKAIAAVPALTEALKDKEIDVRGAAAMALGRMGKKAKAAASGLAAVLSDSDRDVCCAAALALLRIGKDASEAVPSLVKMAKSEDKYVQVYATGALVVLDDKSDGHVRVLADALSDPKVEVRGSAAYVLGELGPLAKASVPALAKALVKDDDKRVRQAVARALGEMGSESKVVVPALIEGLRDSDKEVRSAVAMAIGEVGPSAKEAVPALIDALKDKEFEVRGSAVFALGEIGPAASDAINALSTIVTRDDNAEVRRAAAIAIGKIQE